MRLGLGAGESLNLVDDASLYVLDVFIAVKVAVVFLDIQEVYILVVVTTKLLGVEVASKVDELDVLAKVFLGT